jgi:16S rRNA processing protein RimM
MEDLVVVGRVVRPHGLRGELVVDSDGETLLGLDADDLVWIGDPPEPHGWLGARPHKGRVLLTVVGVEDRDAAEALRGSEVRLVRTSRPELADNEVWVEDLVGARLLAEDRSVLGAIIGVVDSAAHDLLEVESGHGERFFVPMVREWLVEISLDDGEVVMRLPAGLAPESAEA